jgi:hypothetical protein
VEAWCVKEIHKLHWDTIDGKADRAHAGDRNGRSVGHYHKIAGNFGGCYKETDFPEEMTSGFGVGNVKVGR